MERKIRKEVVNLKDVKEAYAAGFNAGASGYAVWYYCPVCGHLIYIQPSSQEHAAIIQFFREKGWGHPTCIQMGNLQQI